MLELLRSIPGQLFLVIFPLLVIVAIVLGRRLINGSQAGCRMPEPSSLSPSAIAALRGDWELVLKTVIFGMWQRGVIELIPEEQVSSGGFRLFGIELKSSGKKRNSMLLRRAAGATAPSDRVEMAVWRFLAKKRKPDEFFKDETLRAFIKTFVSQSRLELERSGLIKSAGRTRQGWFIMSIMMVLVIGTGLAKLELGLRFGMPTMFLLIMLPFAFMAILIGIRPYEKLTLLGRQYLKRLEEHFAWLQEAVKNGEKPAVDPAYAFAIFGTAVLAGTLLYSSFCEAFPSQTTGGCGGGSCGGGSCSGGGCSGGGGCGGCGGGGGD